MRPLVSPLLEVGHQAVQNMLERRQYIQRIDAWIGRTLIFDLLNVLHNHSVDIVSEDQMRDVRYLLVTLRLRISSSVTAFRTSLLLSSSNTTTLHCNCGRRSVTRHGRTVERDVYISVYLVISSGSDSI